MKKHTLLIYAAIIVIACICILSKHIYIIKHSAITISSNQLTVEISDSEDIHILKQILNAIGKYDTPACSFYEDINIMISYKDKKNVFYIANDGCQIVRKNNNSYIKVNNQMWEQLKSVLKKYDILI